MSVSKLSNNVSDFAFLNLSISYAFGRLWSWACNLGNYAYNRINDLFPRAITPHQANDDYFARIQAEFEQPPLVTDCPLPVAVESDEEDFPEFQSHAVIPPEALARSKSTIFDGVGYSKPIWIRCSSKEQVSAEGELLEGLETLSKLKKNQQLSNEELQAAINLIIDLRILDEELDYSYSDRIQEFDSHFRPFLRKIKLTNMWRNKK
jgi:hypothetical protein